MVGRTFLSLQRVGNIDSRSKISFVIGFSVIKRDAELEEKYHWPTEGPLSRQILPVEIQRCEPLPTVTARLELAIVVL
jgi:hypothetical protein